MYNEVAANNRNSAILIVALTFILFLLALIPGLGAGMYLLGNDLIAWIAGVVLAAVIAIVISGGMGAVAWFSGDRLMLMASGARPVRKDEFPFLFHSIEGISIAAGIPKPKAYVIESDALNAFATGRDPQHASIAMTTGLLKTLNRQEAEGVIAHEISHIKNFDIRFMLLVAVLVGSIVFLADMIIHTMRSQRSSKGSAIGYLILIPIIALTPFIAKVISMAISREREFLADGSAALLTRYPPGLASALSKIGGNPYVPTANKAMEHMYIANPMQKDEGILSFVSNMFNTHPPIADRVKRLGGMGDSTGMYKGKHTVTGASVMTYRIAPEPPKAKPLPPVQPAKPGIPPIAPGLPPIARPKSRRQR